MSDDDRVQYKFMIPAALKARLEDAAHENRRSLSAETIARLEASFEISIDYYRADTARLERQQEELRLKIEAMDEKITKLTR
jgi:hypothetical protein